MPAAPIDQQLALLQLALQEQQRNLTPATRAGLSNQATPGMPTSALALNGYVSAMPSAGDRDMEYQRARTDQRMADDAEQAARTKARLLDPVEAAKADAEVADFGRRRNVAPAAAAPVEFTPQNFPAVASHGAPAARSIRRVTPGAAPTPDGPPEVVDTQFGPTVRSLTGIRKLTDAGGALTDPDAALSLKDRALLSPSVLSADAAAEGRVAAAAARGAQPKTQNVPATTQDALTGLNVAEVEGVKVLRELKASGLDQSNDPADPRWEKFVVGTLKIAPGDFQKADIQQRTAMVNAVLTRGLMGGRPSQYVAEMVQQHMPKGEMSGKQLTHVLTNVLQQTGERRQETAHLFGKTVDDLGPVSGETYAQYLAGQPAAGGSGIKSITQIPAR